MKIKLANGTVYDGIVTIDPVNIDGVETSQAKFTLTSGKYDTIKKDFSTLENIAVIEVTNEQGFPVMDSLVSYNYYSITEMNNGSIVVTMIKDEINSKIQKMDEELKILQDEMLNQQEQFDGGELLNSAIFVAKVQAQTLSDTDALQVKNLYHDWNKDPDGYQYSMDNPDDKRRTYNDRLWNLQKNHAKQESWYPGADPTLWMEVVEGHDGTLEDPIPVPDSVTTSGFEYEYGKYYIENDIIYLAKREGKEDGEKEKLFFPPSSLIGQYFEKVDIE